MRMPRVRFCTSAPDNVFRTEYCHVRSCSVSTLLVVHRLSSPEYQDKHCFTRTTVDKELKLIGGFMKAANVKYVTCDMTLTFENED